MHEIDVCIHLDQSPAILLLMVERRIFVFCIQRYGKKIWKEAVWEGARILQQEIQEKKTKKKQTLFRSSVHQEARACVWWEKDFRMDAARELVRSGFSWADARVAHADCSAGACGMRKLPERHRQMRSRLGCVSDGSHASRQGLSAGDCGTNSHAVPGIEDGPSSQR